MNRRDHTFAVALIASLLLHAAIVFVIADEAVRGRGVTTLSAAPAARSSDDVSYFIRLPPPQRLDNLFGDARGAGDAINARRGSEPLLSRDAGQTQAFLSRDPVGLGRIDKEPAVSVLATGSAARSRTKNAPPPPPPPPPRVPFGVDRVEKWSVPHVTRAAAKVAPPAAGPPAAGPDAPGTAGAALPAADPAVMSDSESDPFTTTTTRPSDAVLFRDGRVEARFGRKVKTIRPHLSFASQVDLMSMQYPRLVVRVHIHSDGSVRRVDIVKSSGSSSADQEVKVALYQWWFEPTRESVMEFPIEWR
jgi:TonB family protein